MHRDDGYWWWFCNTVVIYIDHNCLQLVYLDIPVSNNVDIFVLSYVLFSGGIFFCVPLIIKSSRTVVTHKQSSYESAKKCFFVKKKFS